METFVTALKMRMPQRHALIGALIGLILFASSATASAQQYKKITRLGTSQAVCPGGVETASQLQAYFANNPAAIRAILADSGWTGNSEDLLSAVANGQFNERAYPVGTQMAWMGAKVKGQYVANPYREWAGAKSFEAFQVNLSSGCQVYEIAIPKACCNVSLIGVSQDNSNECAPAALSNSDSQAPAVAAAPADSSSRSAKALGLIPFLGIFAGSETRGFEPVWDFDVKDSSGIVGVRAGLLKAISDKTSAFGQLSYYDRNGINEFNVYPEDNIAIDVGLERRLSQRAFIGGGIGVWNIDDSDFSDASVFGHVGGDIGKSNFQWILEARVFDSDSENLDSISDNKMFSAGVRYLIK